MERETAMKILKELHDNSLFSNRIALETLIPELADSNDERIRKALLEMVHDTTGDELWVDYNVHKEEALAWLEKQESVREVVERCKNSWYNEGKIAGMAEGLTNDEKYQQGWHDALEKQCQTFTKKDVDDAYLKGVCDAKHELEKQGEQKPILDFKASNFYVSKVDGKIHDMTYNPTDRVEPKFKVGDYIVNDYCMGRVVEITNDAYLLDTEQGIPFSCEHNVHLWTIKDAKDGDVLYSKKHNLIWIYKDNKHYYASINLNYADAVSFDNGIVIPSDVCPANRVQKSILFQKMEEAGFEWDSEKLELKKIEDEIEIPFGAKDSELQEDTYYIPKGFHAEIDDDKVVIKKGEKSTAWNDEDENYLQSAENACEYQYGKNTSTILWLKSLKDRIGG